MMQPCTEGDALLTTIGLLSMAKTTRVRNKTGRIKRNYYTETKIGLRLGNLREKQDKSPY